MPRPKEGGWRTADPTPAAEAFIKAAGDHAEEAYILLNPGKFGSKLGGGQQALNKILRKVAELTGDKDYLPASYYKDFGGFAAWAEWASHSPWAAPDPRSSHPD